MPTTLSSLLIFVVLLLPGFAYLVGKERHGTERHTSPFRETVAVVAASVTSELAVLTVFAAIRAVRPSWTPDIGALIHDGSAYVAAHYRSLAAWGFVMLGFAILFAYLATMPEVRTRIPLLPAVKDYPHASTVSGWWMLFEKWRYGRDMEVCCILNDGSAVRGKFGSFSSSADDSPDRELLLLAPIRYRAPGRQQMEDYPAGAASVAARNIAVVFTSYDGVPQIRTKRSVPPQEIPALPAEPAQVQEDLPAVPSKAG